MEGEEEEMVVKSVGKVACVILRKSVILVKSHLDDDLLRVKCSVWGRLKATGAKTGREEFIG
jgi:hypothetical protein